ncbi:MAG: hypothetical protein HRT77_04200 [Halioglobus sp.]|nr:hypothetical protein [Halioglobus sp.]
MLVALKLTLKLLVILVIILVAIELLLQLSALIVAATGRKAPTDWSTNNLRVLAIGDSNTFGIYLDEQDSYPAQLETMWNDQIPHQKIEVINLGYPGTNSYQLADIIEGILASTKPDIVLLTVGINDIFTAAEYVESDTNRLHPMTFIRRHSRLYKLFYIAQQGLKTKALELDDTLADQEEPQQPSVNDRQVLRWSDDPQERLRRVQKFKDANATPSEGALHGETMQLGDQTVVMVAPTAPASDSGFKYIQKNLSGIEKKVAESGAKLYLMTYAASASLYQKANQEIIAYAANSPNLSFINVAAEVKKVCPRSNRCPELFFEDLHPKAAGYKIVAETVVSRLEQTLPITADHRGGL